MTRLRQRMLEDMQLRGLSARTQGCYVAAVRQLAEHYPTAVPTQITEEELRQYFLYLANEKQVARATATIALCAIRFFFSRRCTASGRRCSSCGPRRDAKLPRVLSRDEVRRILGLVREPRLPRVLDDDLRGRPAAARRRAAAGRARSTARGMLLHMHGKGGRDRYVPLARAAPSAAARHWRTHRSREWLFSAPTRRGLRHSWRTRAGP